jgi:hypothetical protein
MSSTSPARRIAFGSLPPLVAALPAIALLLAWSDRLPEPSATHFAVDGTADGFSSAATLLWSSLGLAVLLAAVFGTVSATRPTRFLIGVSWAASVLTGATSLLVVLANVDAVDASTVRLSPLPLLLALAVAVTAGVLGARVAPAGVLADAPVTRGGSLDLAPDERVAWSRSVTSAPMQAIGTSLVLGGILLALVVQTFPGVAVAAAGLLSLVFSSSRTTVDGRGLTVAVGPLGRPRWHVPLADVRSAVAGDVSALGRFGGYGYRVVPGGSGVILRSGEALIVTRASGRTFTVTVDDAETGARLLTGLLERSGS